METKLRIILDKYNTVLNNINNFNYSDILIPIVKDIVQLYLNEKIITNNENVFYWGDDGNFDVHSLEDVKECIKNDFEIKTEQYEDTEPVIFSYSLNETLNNLKMTLNQYQPNLFKSNN